MAVLLRGCKEEKLAVGGKAPALGAFDFQGPGSGLDRWQGKSIYLHFWSAGCGGCFAGEDLLVKLSQERGDRGGVGGGENHAG
ncbi:hypothetical protein AAY51_23710, partial [Vibrio parahaemolyticus]